jgi:penicillin-binding protein 2
MAVDRRSTRLGALATVSLVFIGLLGARLWFLQGTQAEAFEAAVARSKTRSVVVAPERGRIFDVTGRIVADNRRVLTIAVERQYLVKDVGRLDLLTRLSGPLDMPVLDLQRAYNPCFPEETVNACDQGILYDNRLPVPLKVDVDEATVTFILERAEDFPGVSVVEGWERVYPYGSLGAHVIGYMGAITAETKDTYLAAGYRINERVGQAGIELSMEEWLHGSWGLRVFTIDAAGNTVEELEGKEAVAGYDIQLSIDMSVQQYAEQALETQLRARRQLPPSRAKDGPKVEIQQQNVMVENPFTLVEEPLDPSRPLGGVPYKAPAGSVIVMNQLNGQILAMASYPTFDPRWFDAGLTKAQFDQVFPTVTIPATEPNTEPKVDPDYSVFVNRAIQGNYNLGSTIKPFNAWSATHLEITTPFEVWEDTVGIYKLQSVDPELCREIKCEFKNARDGTGVPSRYGPIVMQDALAVSSDTFFYRLGERFVVNGLADEWKNALEQWGFGSKSGIQLPFEWGGRVPDDEIKANLVERGVLAANETDFMTTGDYIQVAIGQGLMAATPLQITNAYATIGNGGQLLRPQIIAAIFQPLTPDDEAKPGFVDLPNGTIYQSFVQPEVRLQLDMPADVYFEMVSGLQRVVKGGGVEYPPGYARNPTGYILFRDYDYDKLPIAGKTGTAQGFKSFPWNDSSAFAAFSLDATQPYTIGAYMEKSGYGSRAAAPVVKCLYTMLAGTVVADPVLPADPVNTDLLVGAPSRTLTDPSCLGGVDTTQRE